MKYFLSSSRKYSYRSRASSLPRYRLWLGLVVIFCLYYAGVQVYRGFLRDSHEEARSFVVAPGESLREIADHLEEEEFIESSWWFRGVVTLLGDQSDARVGTASVVPHASYRDVMQALHNPVGAEEVSLTIPEGYTLAQMGEVVRRALPHITEEDWNAAVGVHAPHAQDSFVRLAKKPDSVDLEGYLFPDTYRFFTYATAEDVVERMIRTMESRVKALGNLQGDAQNFSLHEALTLASIIEREVRTPEDMKTVGGVFLKRLAIGMPLQSDATVNYVIGGSDPSLSLHDRDTDTPYNTYLHRGLPPGPISNPGFSAMQGVWQATDNPFYYFLTDSVGRVYYAATHDEHVINKARYMDN